VKQINGVVKGVVTNVNDPEKRGRIKVRFSSLEGRRTLTGFKSRQ